MCVPTRCKTLQHTATHCNTRQHTATHGNTLQHNATHSNTHLLRSHVCGVPVCLHFTQVPHTCVEAPSATHMCLKCLPCCSASLLTFYTPFTHVHIPKHTHIHIHIHTDLSSNQQDLVARPTASDTHVNDFLI